jgi:hypothetical protein
MRGLIPKPLGKNSFLCSVVPATPCMPILVTLPFHLPKDVLKDLSSSICRGQSITYDEQYIAEHTDCVYSVNSSKQKTMKHVVKIVVAHGTFFFDFEVINQLLCFYDYADYIDRLSKAQTWVLSLQQSDIPPYLSDTAERYKTLISSAYEFISNFCPNRNLLSYSSNWDVLVDTSLSSDDFSTLLQESDVLDLLGDECLRDVALETLLTSACSSNKNILVLNTHFLESLPLEKVAKENGEIESDGEFRKRYNDKALRIGEKLSEKMDLLASKGFPVKHILLPLNLGKIHWALAIASVEERTIISYEPLSSLSSYHKAAKKKFLSILTCLNGVHKNQKEKWRILKKNGPDITVPAQHDDTACGIFVVTFAEIFATHGVTDQVGMWGQQNIRILRLRALHSLLVLARPP